MINKKATALGFAVTPGLGLFLGAAEPVDEAQAAVCNGSALKVTETSSKARNTCGHAEAILIRANANGNFY